MSELPEISVSTANRPQNATVWERDQHARVTFQTMSGKVEAWVDSEGWLVLRGPVKLLVAPDGQSQIRVRC